MRELSYGDLRPCPVDTDCLPGEETVWIDIFDVCNIPPKLLDTGEGRGHGREDGEGSARSGPHCER